MSHEAKAPKAKKPAHAKKAVKHTRHESAAVKKKKAAAEKKWDRKHPKAAAKERATGKLTAYGEKAKAKAGTHTDKTAHKAKAAHKVHNGKAHHEQYDKPHLPAREG